MLAAVARDLRQGFGEHYRILRAGSGKEALGVLAELRTRGDPVAMLVADQRMPEMDGTDYLIEARKIYPEAKRVLLTAYADTQAAISAINDVGLDYYLLKPWDPPKEKLFPVVQDLLTTWEAGRRWNRAACASSVTASPGRPTTCATSWPETACPRAGWTSSATARPASC